MFLMMIIRIWTAFVRWTRPFVKGVLRKATSLCELQRICYGELPGAARAIAAEKCMRRSRLTAMHAVLTRLDDVADQRRLHPDAQVQIFRNVSAMVMHLKRINPNVHPTFSKSFERCIQLIWGYRQLCSLVENLRTTQYDSDDLSHEEKLLELWKLLMPREPLEGRITKQWQDIGFQGDDPKTDFRGMGMLGLENLLYFAKEFPGASSHVLSHSHHPKYGYTFAIVGINLTSMAYNLLKDGSARTHIYNVSKGLPSIKNFHQLYCYLFYEFDRFWLESKPQNMMEFSNIQRKFEKSIRDSLKNKSTVFRINIKIDTV